MSVTEAPNRAAASPQLSRTEIEANGAVPILYLFGGALVWLLLASVLELLASVKLHMPGLLAGSALLTYGRVQAASQSLFIYGFGVPAALGSGLWLLCRLGKTRLAGPGVVTLGTLFWNFAVTAGLWAILRGANTGYAALEFPRAVASVLLIAYLVISVCGIVTFHHRAAAPLYPSQWFVVGALFWFAWIYSTVMGLLLCTPARGVLQASVDWWYQHNLSTVYFGFAGLASIFYFIPKLTRRPLHSRLQAAFAFWMLALVGSWGGIPDGSPLPSWIIGMSVVGTVFTLVPILAVVINLRETTAHSMPSLDANPCLRFTCVGLLFWVIASVQEVVAALPSVGALTNFTWFTVAQRDLFRYGFLAMTMFGAFYYIAPRLAAPKSASPDSLWCPRLYKAHFWLTILGVFIGYISLLAAGLWQGVMLNNSANSFMAVLKSSMTAIRMSTTGPLLFAVGTLVFLLNFAQLLKNNCCPCCQRKGDA